MSERDRGEDRPAPGNWRVTAQPYSAVPAQAGAAAAPVSPAPPLAGSQAAPLPAEAAPVRSGGHPLIATAICLGLLLLSLAGQSATPMDLDGPASSAGFVFGGALFGAILWGIAFAITIRKASTRWKLGSLIVLAVLGGLIALNKVAKAGAAAPAAPLPVVRTGK